MFANSKDVADFFDKRHAEVLKDIRHVQKSLSGEISPLWFRASTYQYRLVSGGMKTSPAYDMTRDGFVLLVMGYTGKKVMEFKVRYVPC